MSVDARTDATTGDVIDFLQAQHDEVKSLFAQLESGGESRREPFECLVRLLAVHETAEEEVVYPALRSTGPDGERMAEARKAEEAQAKEALSELERIDVAGSGFDPKLQAFRQMVLEHAEREEQEVFPTLRQNLDADTLRAMRTAVEAAERMAPTHPHPHGPESATGNLLVGPFVAIADKVRDALRGAKNR